MATSDFKGLRPADASTAAARAKRKRTRVKFGDIVVLAHKPTAAEVKGNVAQGTLALQNLKARLLRPGVRVNAKKNVPLYFADPDRRGVYVRKLNGKVERGVLENGVFKVTE